ncbi:hypothetical protein ACWCPQ_00790 [Nocardia sp. NPDC001965]
MSDAESPRYYGLRGVTSEIEQNMRADHWCLDRLRGDRSGLVDPSKQDKIDTAAAELEAVWSRHDCADVRENWEYLCGAVARWRHNSEAMEELHRRVLVALADGSDTGATDVQWRSIRQARAATGHGPWPPVRDPLSATRLHPYAPLDQANPSYHSGRRASTWPEQVMRADFARVHQLRKQRVRLDSDLDRQQAAEEMHAVAEPWMTRHDALGLQWRMMCTLAAGIYTNYFGFAEAVAQIVQPLDAYEPLSVRSISQVQELKGIQPPADIDASHTPGPIASSSFAAARTAELAHRNGGPRNRP